MRRDLNLWLTIFADDASTTQGILAKRVGTSGDRVMDLGDGETDPRPVNEADGCRSCRVRPVTISVALFGRSTKTRSTRSRSPTVRSTFSCASGTRNAIAAAWADPVLRRSPLPAASSRHALILGAADQGHHRVELRQQGALVLARLLHLARIGTRIDGAAGRKRGRVRGPPCARGRARKSASPSPPAGVMLDSVLQDADLPGRLARRAAPSSTSPNRITHEPVKPCRARSSPGPYRVFPLSYSA